MSKYYELIITTINSPFIPNQYTYQVNSYLLNMYFAVFSYHVFEFYIFTFFYAFEFSYHCYSMVIHR